jgi:acetyl-CoA acyltransferase
MKEIVIVSAARTAIGRSPKGTLRFTRPDDLAAVVIRAALERAKGVAAEDVDDVILGCATPEMEQGFDIARIATLRAGLPESIPAVTLNRFCASGLEAIAVGASKIAAGQADIVIAGGAESMTMVPFMGDTLRPNAALAEKAPNTYLNMGLSTEGVAKHYRIGRDAADAFALDSHRKAVAARDSGRFDPEIAPVKVTIQDPATLVEATAMFNRDEGPRADTSTEALAKLKPAFSEDGVITAGNASQRSDGAAAVMLMSLDRASALGLKPLARFAGYSVVAVKPEEFGIAPAYAIPKVLERTGKKIGDIDLIELNEAFAAQVLASDKLFPLPMDRVNVNGGAVALGHPLGATGARQTVTLVHEAARRKAKWGLVSMCAALGMGAAGLFEFE